jgi:hypothetical protein
MELRFQLSGSVLYSTKADSAPSVGSVVRIQTNSYKKGLYKGSIIEVPITSDQPPEWDFTEGPEPIVFISLNGYTVIQEGSAPDEDDTTHLQLNSGNMLIRDELVSEGSIDQAAVYVREVIRRAMDLGSAAIILVHNHPSGDPKPSKQDIALTRDMVEAGRHFGISVHDHVIIGAQGHSSMRALGLL